MSKPQYSSITLPKDVLDLVRAEADKHHRSMRDWLQMYLTVALPLPESYSLDVLYACKKAGIPAPNLDRLISTPTTIPSQQSPKTVATSQQYQPKPELKAPKDEIDEWIDSIQD